MNEFFADNIGPISVIATLLAAFFVVMAVFRHLGVKHAREQRDRDGLKPYRIANPYSTEAAATAPPATFAAPPTAPDPASDPSSKIFRQYGQIAATAKDKTSDPSGYTWE